MTTMLGAVREVGGALLIALAILGVSFLFAWGFGTLAKETRRPPADPPIHVRRVPMDRDAA